ncbi:Uma2 domain-containing protein [Gammaproteobacteria bacterium]
MSTKRLTPTKGSFQAEYLRSGDPYELSHGHAILCLPTGGQGSRANLLGGVVLDSDPAVDEAGVDTGFSPSPGMLRAPDVAVGKIPNAPGWVKGVPSLAVEYADSGQDEAELANKIKDLIGCGTGMIWVVRLTGPRRVEVHRPRRAVQVYFPGQLLTAPGVLKNPVPVEALYDRNAAHEAALRNLLQRRGYSSIEEIRTEARAEGKAEGKTEGKTEGKASLLLLQFHYRFGSVPAEIESYVRVADSDHLDEWSKQLIDGKSLSEIFSTLHFSNR